MIVDSCNSARKNKQRESPTLPAVPCQRCQWAKDVPVGYVVNVYGVARFNVDMAELIIVKRPREPIEIPVHLIGRYVRPEWIEAAHVGHVSGNKPGIVAQVSHVKGVCRVLIDGRHRVTKSLYDGKSAKVYLLTKAETDACIIKRMTAPGKARKRKK